MTLRRSLSTLLLAALLPAHAQTLRVALHAVDHDGVRALIGQINAIKDGRPLAALAAGGHFDPQGSGHLAGPTGEGHLSDLPPLQVDGDGHATQGLLAPRLRMSQVLERSLIFHAGGDKLSDQPAPLGGGGARTACGVIAVTPPDLAARPWVTLLPQSAR